MKCEELCILLRDSVKCETHMCSQVKSFQNYQLTFTSGWYMCSFCYYLQITPNQEKGLKAADFFKEISEFVESVAINSGHLLILGEFKIYWDYERNADTKQKRLTFLDLPN